MIDDVLQGRETEIADELVHKVKGEFVSIKNDILARAPDPKSILA